MMCASSTTRQPARGPPAISAALPVRLALGEEGLEALAEILAGVAENDEILVVDLGRGGVEAAQRLLGGAQGELRLVRQEVGRASCREECVSTCRSRWSPYH